LAQALLLESSVPLKQKSCVRSLVCYSAMSDKENYDPQTSLSSPSPVTPVSGLKRIAFVEEEMSFSVHIRRTFIHCSPAPSSAATPPPRRPGATPLSLSEPRHCRPNLGRSSGGRRSGAGSDLAPAGSPEALPKTPTSWAHIPATPSTAGSFLTRELMPVLVPALSLYADLAMSPRSSSQSRSRRKTPTKLSLCDLVSPSDVAWRPIRLSDHLPDPATASPAVGQDSNDAMPTDTDVCRESNAPPSAPLALGRPPQRPPRTAAQPPPQPPLLLQALLLDPGLRKGRPGHSAVGGERSKVGTEGTDEEFRPKRLSYSLEHVL